MAARVICMCFAAVTLATTPPAASARITLAELLRPAAPTAAPLSDDDFARPAEALPPSNTMHGRLTLLDTAAVRFELLRDDFNYGGFATRQRLPPGFTVQYTIDGDRVVPVKTGLVYTNDLVWNLFFTTGHAWDEPGDMDDGWSRAAVPFAMSERNANCVHNGLVLFAFRNAPPSGLAEISFARVQITQETCLYFKANYWGQLPTAFEPTVPTMPHFIAARARDAREVAERLPTVPIAQLAADYPGVDPNVFGGSLTPVHVSSLGVMVGGTHYVRECVTRTGGYAGLCDELMLPSYSTSKSIFGGLGLMRLAHLYGNAVYQELVRTWLPDEVAAARAGDWQSVTLLDCLNMMTGNYESAVYQRDEDAFTDEFFREETFAGKIAPSFGWPAREPPAQRHIYHTTDTFILTAAMQRLVKARGRALNHSAPVAANRTTSTSARRHDDIWEMLVADIMEPLRLSTSALSTLRTYDDEAQPYGGMGLWFKRDDLAKIGNWLRNGGGRLPDRGQVVDNTALNAAMQLDPSNRGLNPQHPSLNLRYNYGFWAQVYNGPAHGCAKPEYFQPYLSGYGGIRIVMLGNGAVYSYVSDNAEVSMTLEVQESRGFGPLC